MRFSLDLKRNKIKDDILRIEYFSSLSEAQSGFTEDGEIFYSRFIGFLSWADLQIYVILGSIGLGILVIGISVLVIFKRRKRKKKL